MDNDLKSKSDQKIIEECLMDYMLLSRTLQEDMNYVIGIIMCCEDIERLSKCPTSKFYGYFQEAFEWAMKDREYQNFPCIQKAYDLFKCGENKN